MPRILPSDVRFAVRSLGRSPPFTAVAVLTLALGIGATTAIFSVVNGVLLRPLPYPAPDRLVRVWQVNDRGGRMNFSDPDFADVRDRSRTFAALAEVSGRIVVSVDGITEPVRANAVIVSRQFLDVMGVQPVEGRGFAPEELQTNGRPAVIVSRRFWSDALGGAPLSAGTTIRFEGNVHTVVGVMPANLDYPAGTDIWMPRELREWNPNRTAHNYGLVGRLVPDASLSLVGREVSDIARRLKEEHGAATDMVDAVVVPLQEQLVGSVRSTLLVLLAAAAVLLLIACANVAGLMMARASAREGEFAVRLALGASRMRIARQFVAEALVLALGGAVLGFAVAAVSVPALLSIQPRQVPRLEEVHVNLFVLGAALVLAVLTAAGMGVMTAWRVCHGSIRDTLAQAQRTQARSGVTMRVRNALVAGQVAAALVLLVGVGLLSRSLARLLSVEPGFRTENALVVEVSPTSAADPAAHRAVATFYDELTARLEAIPGVQHVGGVNVLPLDGTSAGNGTFLILNAGEDLTIDAMRALARNPDRTGSAEFRVASAGYFRAMQIPLVRGRLFDAHDATDAPHVAVISQSLAERRWPREDPIGKTIQFGNMDGDVRPFTIVGIVGDVREGSLGTPPQPTFYAFYRQRPVTARPFSFVLDGPAVEHAAVLGAVRNAVRDLRPDLPPRIHTIESVVSRSVADRRFALVLIGVYGASALLLAALGVYGAISYLVRQRRQELGVRLALGAQPADVLTLVVREGAMLALIGVLIGASVAFAVTRLISGMLFGVSPTDPLSFLAVSVALTGVVLIASLIPARRAARLDPLVAMRAE